MDHSERSIEFLAHSQAGRFNRRQVTELVGDRNRGRALIQRRLRSERWRRLTSRVLCLPGASGDAIGRMWTAYLHLGTDVVLSHASAALLWGFPLPAPTSVHIMLPDGANRQLEGCRTRQCSDLEHADVVRCRDLPTTTPARTLADLSTEVSRVRLDSLIDHALGERLVSMPELQRQLNVLSRPHKRLANFGSVLAERMPGHGTEKSALERALTRVLESVGLPLGVAQFPLPARPGDSSGLVDRAWPEIRWIVEVDGRRWHARHQNMQADRARDRSAQALGWLTTRVTHEDLVVAPRPTGSDLVQIYRRRSNEVAALDSA